MALRRWHRSAVGRRDPGNLAELDALLGEFARLVGAGLAVNAARVGLAIVNLARLFGELRTDIVAIFLDLLTQRDQRLPHLHRRHRRPRSRAFPMLGRHQRLLDLRVAAFRAGDLARLLLRLTGRAIAEPRFEFVL